MKSNELMITEVPVTGNQSPILVMGLPGEKSTITCSVPFNLTFSVLSDLRYLITLYTNCSSSVKSKINFGWLSSSKLQ